MGLAKLSDVRFFQPASHGPPPTAALTPESTSSDILTDTLTGGCNQAGPNDAQLISASQAINSAEKVLADLSRDSYLQCSQNYWGGEDDDEEEDVDDDGSDDPGAMEQCFLSTDKAAEHTEQLLAAAGRYAPLTSTAGHENMHSTIIEEVEKRIQQSLAMGSLPSRNGTATVTATNELLSMIQDDIALDKVHGNSAIAAIHARMEALRGGAITHRPAPFGNNACNDVQPGRISASASPAALREDDQPPHPHQTPLRHGGTHDDWDAQIAAVRGSHSVATDFDVRFAALGGRPGAASSKTQVSDKQASYSVKSGTFALTDQQC